MRLAHWESEAESARQVVNHLGTDWEDWRLKGNTHWLQLSTNARALIWGWQRTG